MMKPPQSTMQPPLRFLRHPSAVAARPVDDEAAATRLLHRRQAQVMVMDYVVGGRVQVPIQADGYAFTWGQIVERHFGLMVVWDFHLARMRDVFKVMGLGLTTLQERTIDALEHFQAALVVRDNALCLDVMSPVRGWRIIPAPLGRGSAFSIVAHAGDESDARDWLIAEFMPETLPRLQEALIHGL